MKIVQILYLPFLSLIYLIISLVPKKKKIWIFGGWFGKKYSDNSKYLFEYISVNHKDIRTIWITHKKQIRELIRKKGFEAYLSYEIKGIFYSIRANSAIICQTKQDIGAILLGGKKVVQLWHAIPLKKIMYDHEYDNKIYTNFFRVVKKYLFPFQYEKYNMSIASSIEVQSRMMSAYKLKRSQVKITGYPRNDIILADSKCNPYPLILSKNKNIKRYVLFAPTFRKDETEMLKIFNGLNYFKLNQIMVNYDCMYLIKLHYAAKKLVPILSDEKTFSNITFITDSEAKDINYLLPHIDILITDYSGIYMDYLLLDRPIIFAPFDIDNYVASDRELYEDYYIATSCGQIVENWDELVIVLEKILNRGDLHKNNRNIALDKYQTFRDTQNCSRIYNEIKSL